MQHESSFVNASSLLAEEVLKVPEKQFVLVNKEREHAGSAEAPGKFVTGDPDLKR